MSMSKPFPVPRSSIETSVDTLLIARQVIETEIMGLTRLSAVLNKSFSRAIDTLDAVNGRIIVTGMGKSGHVARKIAATFSSTGAPAQFVHPGEASHGDLGMITAADAIIMLSNSGEAPELSDVIAYAKRFSIALIAMTAVETSTLARAADIVLQLPQSPEACSLGLAPTTSTTMMMALGDALAVALLEKRGFGRDDFTVFHPGGKLGRALLRVSALMHADNMPLAHATAPMREVIITMTAGRCGCAGIVDSAGRLIGIITDGDLRRHLSPTIMETPAEKIMTAGPQTIAGDALAGEALRLMTERPSPILVLFVVEDEKPVGVLHMHDLLRAGVA